MADSDFARPALPALVQRVLDDVQSHITGSDARLRRTIYRATAAAEAGLTHELYGYLDTIARQVLPDLCDEAQLLRWGALLGVERRPATYATIVALFDVAEPGPDVYILAGATIRRLDGVTYVTGDDSGGGVETEMPVAMTAVVAGADGNVEPGTLVQLASPVAGVASTGTTVGPESEYYAWAEAGADEEALEDYRARVIARAREGASGGTATDWPQWVREVEAVDGVWVTSGDDAHGRPGRVIIHFVVDGDGVARIPSSDDKDALVEALEVHRPVVSTLDMRIPTPYYVKVLVTAQPNGDAAVEAAIEAELEAFFAARADAIGGTIYNSQLRNAISDAPGETSHVVTDILADTSSPPTTSIGATGDVTAAWGQYPVLHSVVFG